MKFGKVEDPSQIDFNLPQDHPDTSKLLKKLKKPEKPSFFVGCAKWNKQDLKNFYPRGTKDELQYYASQFNSIELNASFYRLFPKEQFETWREKTPDDFRFFPKITRMISHIKRLKDSKPLIDEYVDHVILLKEKLATVFLQLHDNFQPKNWDRVEEFVTNWPGQQPLAIEFRHTDWFNDSEVSKQLFSLLEDHKMANVLVDTAGRRDIMHMRMTNGEAFIRFVGANHPSDYDRLDAWVERLNSWVDQGLQQVDFFIHQNTEKESPLLAEYFIKKINKTMSLDIPVPRGLSDGNNPKLDL
ncbi:MAG TPA: DUF72 domain-containing protein [Leeuwenhoekiella sp.]|nr:DUF72 domain-containing protein [Leeuwenhoekiella sp.]